MIEDAERPTPEVDHAGWDRHTVLREGVSLAYYRDPGDGPALVGVHGITAWGPDLFDLTAALGNHDVVVVDIRGHGRSGAPESGYDLETAAADLRAVIEGAGVESPRLLGHSLGGGIVTTYAARYPATAVVAVDPVGLLGDGDDADSESDDADSDGDEGEDGPDEWVPALIEEGRAALRKSDRDNAEPGAAYAHHRVRRFGGDAVADPTDRYERIDAPVLVLRADVSGADRDRDDALLAALPESRVVYVDGAGHVVHRDRPERTAGLVREFLAEHG